MHILLCIEKPAYVTILFIETVYILLYYEICIENMQFLVYIEHLHILL